MSRKGALQVFKFVNAQRITDSIQSRTKFKKSARKLLNSAILALALKPFVKIKPIIPADFVTIESIREMKFSLLSNTIPISKISEITTMILSSVL